MAPESALWPLSQRRINILWATDSSGGSKSRTVLKSLLFRSFRTEQVKLTCYYRNSTVLAFSVSIC